MTAPPSDSPRLPEEERKWLEWKVELLFDGPYGQACLEVVDRFINGDIAVRDRGAEGDDW